MATFNTPNSHSAPWMPTRLVRTRQDEKITAEAVQSATAKVSSVSGSVATSGASLVSSVQKDDAIQASADVLKLGAASLAKAAPVSAAPVASSTSAAASVITSVNKAAQGDTFAAASAASSAIEAVSPALAKSPVGAIANVFVLGTAGATGLKQTEAVKASAQRAVAPGAPVGARIKAGLDLTAAVQNLANFYRYVGNAAYKLTGFGLAGATKVATLAPAALKAQSGIAKVATSPLGKTVGFLNKWLPFLNVAGVAISANSAVEVFHSDKSSTTSKALSIASVGAAFAALVGGFTLKGLPFVGTLLAGIGADIALAHARQSDAAGLDTDAQSRHWLLHPDAAVRDLASWGRTEIPAFFGSIKHTITQGFGRVKTALTRKQGISANAPLTGN